MEEIAVTIPDIRALVAERQRFDDWLNALEARREETPVRVFERVHGDYLARRDAVVEKLHTHIGSLEAMERDLNDRLEKLETELAEREDERAEAMLRTAVGEYDSERWETTRHEVEANISQLGQERETLIAETDDVRGLLASARHRPPGREPEPVPEPEPLVVATVDDVQEELVSSNVAESIANADPAAAEHAVELNETGLPESTSTPSPFGSTDPFLRAVNAREARDAQVDADIETAFAVSDSDLAGLSDTRSETPAPDALPQRSPSAGNTFATEGRETNAAFSARAADTSRAADVFDDLDVFGEPAPRANQADPRASNDTYAPRSGSAHPSANPAPARDSFDDLAFLKSITDSPSGASSATGTPRTAGSTDQAKTLRCTECGTMNFPTEWYCERCGGELAAF